MERKRLELLARLPQETSASSASGHDPSLLQEWMDLVSTRDRLLREQIERENQQLLDTHFRQLNELLVVIGQFSHQDTPVNLKRCLCALYWELQAYRENRDLEEISRDDNNSYENIQLRLSDDFTEMDDNVLTAETGLMTGLSIQNDLIPSEQETAIHPVINITLDSKPEVDFQEYVNIGPHTKGSSECSETESAFAEILNSTPQSEPAVFSELVHTDNDLSTIIGEDTSHFEYNPNDTSGIGCDFTGGSDMAKKQNLSMSHIQQPLVQAPILLTNKSVDENFLTPRSVRPFPSLQQSIMKSTKRSTLAGLNEIANYKDFSLSPALQAPKTSQVSGVPQGETSGGSSKAESTDKRDGPEVEDDALEKELCLSID